MHNHFHELRLRAVDARADVRTAKDAYEVAKAVAEQAAIDDGRASGPNAEARARSLTVALQTDSAYTAALRLLRTAEAEAERVEALLEAARDERRAAEWQIRAQLAAALMGTDIPSDGDDPYGDDSFDNALQASADRRAVYVSDPFDHAMHAA